MASQHLITEVGNNIRALRLQKGKGQTEVAKALSISVAALSKIENGQTDINLSRLLQVAKYFGVSVVSLLSKDLANTAPQEVIEEVTELKKLLAEKEAEVFKLQKKVIDLYDKLGL
ncbi:helix-turn-helix domain-containing protein [Pedobacter nanyangensis]|uniref:helix-turn-helix domain-containing protein n=1 Tax=Pedobacter nanyangensis TaxID=1562389 RepID=UPI001F065EB9|nr:helix-turn-helix transcriptional regulator [Pedobacter nanyangensis]